jgi:16S rRNA (cytosine1402-N4)-methyltransferase
MDPYHIPVLLQIACNYLNVKKHELYLDATLGGGGHTAEIIRRGGKVLALDQDQDAIDFCREKFRSEIAAGDLIIFKSPFSHLDEILQHQKVAGALFDLGVSSHQFDQAVRGFSFQKDGPLDMRMDQSLPHTAFSLIKILSPKQLNQIFSDFGEIQNGYHLAEKISQEKPDTTLKLAKIIKDPNLIRPLFQALRIAVNAELSELETALPKAYSALHPGGRLVVISFHSLEDRVVKNLGLGQVLTSSPVVPDASEMTTNPRSKSAKLRAFLKPYV